MLSPQCVSVATSGVGTNTWTSTMTNNCGMRVKVWGGVMLNGAPVEWVWIGSQARDPNTARFTLKAGETSSSMPYPFKCCGTYGWQVMAVMADE